MIWNEIKSDIEEYADPGESCYKQSGPGGIRTPDRRVKSPLLYLAELPAPVRRISNSFINLLTESIMLIKT